MKYLSPPGTEALAFSSPLHNWSISKTVDVGPKQWAYEVGGWAQFTSELLPVAMSAVFNSAEG